jgi:hypothetical protein
LNLFRCSVNKLYRCLGERSGYAEQHAKLRKLPQLLGIAMLRAICAWL